MQYRVDATRVDGSVVVYLSEGTYDEACSEMKSRKHAVVLEIRLSKVQGKHATLLKRITKTPHMGKGSWTGGL